MAILEVTAAAQVIKILELNRLTTIKLELYAAFIGATPDQVVEECLRLIFREDDSFQNFLITKRAEAIHSNLQQEAIREIQLRDKEFTEFLANDSDRSDDSEHKFRITTYASSRLRA